jgi:threonine dehydratase
VTAVSAGNHAMAVAFAAGRFGSSAKVVMPRSADAGRIAGARRLGAEVVLVDDVHQAFAEVDRIVAQEGRAFVHPFEGETVATGTGTIALEMLADAADLDAVIVPIGGGGLCAGIAAAIKQRRPQIRVFGVEPEGADTMHRSFAAGSPQPIERVDTIADSLGAPHAAAYSYGLCRAHVDDLVRVDDDALCRAMAIVAADLKLAVEPAGAASTAALLGPLSERLAGAHVGVIVCGANIAPHTWAELVTRGQASLQSRTERQ